MKSPLKIRFFAHSWISDWNHGNAHFLRGLASELVRLGHDVRCYEQSNSWSMTHLKEESQDAVADAFSRFRRAFPTLDVRFYKNDEGFPRFAKDELRESDVVVVHEWTLAELVKEILDLKEELGFTTLLHDTHHRAYTNPKEILAMPVDLFDGVLAFGEAIRRIYHDGFGVSRVWTFHEAADAAHFRPQKTTKDTDVLWIGNWGDEERTRELEEFLLEPATESKDKSFVVHGVRYPAEAQHKLSAAGIEYRGYLPNLSAPETYARSKLSLHIPRRFYANGLSGIPTIRVFEALACGVPLICSPWADTEGLFRSQEDYVVVKDGRNMKAELLHLLSDKAARQQIAKNGLQTVLKRHTCAHRANEFVEIVEELGR